MCSWDSISKYFYISTAVIQISVIVLTVNYTSECQLFRKYLATLCKWLVQFFVCKWNLSYATSIQHVISQLLPCYYPSSVALTRTLWPVSILKPCHTLFSLVFKFLPISGSVVQRTLGKPCTFHFFQVISLFPSVGLNILYNVVFPSLFMITSLHKLCILGKLFRKVCLQASCTFLSSVNVRFPSQLWALF